MLIAPGAKDASSQELLKAHAEELGDLLRRIDDDTESDRLAQISIAKKAALYWQGKQYLRPTYDKESRILDWEPIDFAAQKEKVFSRVENIIYADGIKFASLVGQRRPNQRAVPDDPDDYRMVRAARVANSTIRHLHRYWRLPRRIGNEIAQNLWTTGPVFGFTHYIPNAAQHGWHEQEEWGSETVTLPGEVACPGCMARHPEGTSVCQYCGADLSMVSAMPGPTIERPKSLGVKRYELGEVELELLNCFYVSVPFGSRDIKGSDWLDYSLMVTDSERKAILRTIGERSLDGATGEPSQPAVDAWEAIGSLRSPDGVADQEQLKKRQTFSRRWVRPAVYDGLKLSSRRDLKKNYPSGLVIYRMNGEVFRLEAKTMDDYWAVCKPGTDEYINSPGLCSVMMTEQDALNDFWNMATEIILRTAPKHIIDSSLVDREQVRTGEAQVHELIFTRTGGADLSKAFTTIPTARVPADLFSVAGHIREHTRDAGGVQPVLFGGGDPAPTYRADSMRKNQALAQFQPPFEEIQDFISAIDYNATREAARYGIGSRLIPPAGQTGLQVAERVDLEDLQEDGWHVEADEAAPMTHAERVERIGALAADNPILAQQVGVMHPMNARKNQGFFGLDDYYAPGQFDWDRVRERIQMLLEGQPIVAVDPMTGQPKEQPSIPPDEFEDKEHGKIADMIRIWCTSDAGRAAREKNPQGYRNVQLHGLAQDMMAMPPPQPGPPAPDAPPAPNAPPANTAPPPQ